MDNQKLAVSFRVDSSSIIGSGHVVRCITLAKSLRKKGVYSFFICKGHKKNFTDLIKDEKFELHILDNKHSKKNSKKKYDNWLGSSWQDDAKQTIDIIKKKKIDWLIIDHYAIDELWQKKIRPYVKKIMVIDDLADRNHDCDLLLDYNLIENYNSRYKKLLQKNCNKLIGPNYALLQNQYRKLHLSTPIRTDGIKRIFIFFGGVDKNNLTYPTLIKCLNNFKNKFIFDVVVNSENINFKKIKLMSQQNKNIILHCNLPNLSQLISKADLAIGASGVNAWERCCLGLPSIIITVADNQIPIAKLLHKKKLAIWLGHYNKINFKKINKCIKYFSLKKLKDYSERCKSIIDGEGTEKVASILTLNSKTKLNVRSIEVNDEHLIIDKFLKPLKLKKNKNFKLKSINISKNLFYH